MKGVSAEEIISRMLEATGSKREINLANWLGVTPQSLSNAKKKGTIPPAWIMDVAVKNGISLDWLYFGVGNVRRAGAAEGGPGLNIRFDRSVLFEVVEVVDDFLAVVKKTLPPETKAELVCQFYQLVIEGGGSLRSSVPMLKLLQSALAASE